MCPDRLIHLGYLQKSNLLRAHILRMIRDRILRRSPAFKALKRILCFLLRISTGFGCIYYVFSNFSSVKTAHTDPVCTTTFARKNWSVYIQHLLLGCGLHNMFHHGFKYLYHNLLFQFSLSANNSIQLRHPHSERI